MVRSDYRAPVSRACTTPGPLRLALDLPVRRPRPPSSRRLRTLLPRRRGRGAPRRARRRRAGLRARAASCASSRARRRTTARSCSTAPATPSSARRTGRSSRRSTSSTRASLPERAARGAGLRRRRADAPAARPARPGSASCRPRRRPIRTRSATGCTPRSPTSWSASRRAPACCLVLEDAHWADAPTLLLLRHLARAARTRACCCSRTFRDTEADAARGARRRRSPTCAAPRTSCGCAWRASPARRSASSCAARPAASSGRRCPSWRDAISDLTERQPVPRLRAVARAGRDRSRRDRRRDTIRVTRPAARARHARRACARSSSQRLSRLAADDRPTCSSWRRSPGRSSSSASLRRAAGLRGADAARRARRGGAQRHDRGAPARGPRLPLHARARAPRALRPPVGAAPRRAPPARRRGAAGAAGDAARTARSPTSRTTSPRRRRSARPARGRRVQPSRRAAAAASALAFDEAAERLAHARSRSGSTTRRSGPASCSSWARVRHLRRQGARRDGGVPARGARSPASWATTELLARAAIGYEDACWRPGFTDRGHRRAARGGRRPRSARRTPSCASGCSAGSRARSTSRASTTRAASCATSAIAMARRLDDRRGLATVLMRSYWSRGTTSLEEILAMLSEAARARGGARRHRAQRRGDGLAGPGLRRAVRHGRRARGGRGAPRHRRAAPRSRSCSTSPSTTARRSRSCDGRLDEARGTSRSARTSGAAC